MTTRPGYVWDATASAWVEIGQAAVLAPIKYQASQPSSPATGDIWIDSDDEVPSVDSTLYYRWTKTMSGGETSLSGTDNNSLALKYTAGYESVFINGVLQVRGSDYVATTGTTVTGLTALTASDVVMVESIVAYSTGDTYTQSQMTSLLDAKSPVSTTGLVLISSTTIGSAVTSVTVSNVFSATYDNYKILINNVDASVDDNYIALKFNNSTGSTYAFSMNLLTLPSTSTITGSASTANGISVGLTGQTNNTSAQIEVLNPFNAFWTSTTQMFAGTNQLGFSCGIDKNSASQTGFSITVLASGNLTGGTIKVYGYK